MTDRDKETKGLLLERDRELDAVRRALAEAMGGEGAFLFVEGTAGIGKTLLLTEAAALAEGTGFLARTARGGEMERDMPFGIVGQLFQTLVERAPETDRREWLRGSAKQSLLALGETATGTLGPPDAFAAINGLYWLVDNIAVKTPLFLSIDDSQWADPVSLRFISFLVRRLAGLKVVVIVAVRSGEPESPAELGPLRSEARLLTLEPLSETAVRTLISSIAGAAADEGLVGACLSASRGNPFLLVELMREIGSAADHPEGPGASAVSTVAPSEVERTVLLRLGRFGHSAVRLARAVSVLGRAARPAVVAALAELDEETTASICDDLRRAEILAPGVPIDFVHPLVRQAVYREQPEGERARMHREAAELLVAMNADPVEVAAHLLLLPTDTDAWVVERLEIAAQSAIAEGAYDSAVTYLERALAEAPGDSSTLHLLGVALREADIFRAPDVLAEAANSTKDPVQRLDVLRHLSLAYLGRGDLAMAAEATESALELALDNRELALALEAQRHFLQVVAAGRDPASAARIESIGRSVRGLSSGERLVREALGLERFFECASVEEVADLILPLPEDVWEIEGMESPVYLIACKLLAWAGKWSEARAAFSEWTETADQRGQVLAVSLGHSFVAEVDRLSGRLVDSEAEARTAWDIVGMSEGFSSYHWSALMNLCAALLARGDLAGFDELTHGMDLSAGPLEIPLNPWPLELRAYAGRASGKLEEAADDLLTLGAAMERLGFYNPGLPPWRQDAAEMLVELGRHAEAEEVLAPAEERAASFGAGHVIGSTLRARGLLQPPKRSIETLERSVAAFGQQGPPHEVSRSLLALGKTMHLSGRRGEAREPLKRAVLVAESCGANGIEREARLELEAAGGRPGRKPRTGIAALTAAERRTAELAASGLTNKEIAERLFVTVRTVETHLTHVYDKLSVDRRAALAGALRPEGAGPL